MHSDKQLSKMKKAYHEPSTIVELLRMESALLAGSGEAKQDAEIPSGLPGFGGAPKKVF